jgi:hypothetical protein
MNRAGPASGAAKIVIQGLLFFAFYLTPDGF